jgi:hypothetical protein
VEQYAAALRNGDLQRANALTNAVARETGKPEVTTFEAGRVIMADEVVRLLTSTGGTEQDREGMQRILSGWSSPAQFAGLFEVFKDFTGARFIAMENSYALGNPKREEEFKQRFLTPDARVVFGKMRPASEGAGGGELPPAARAQLQEGHETTFGNGQVWTLQNGQPKRIR